MKIVVFIDFLSPPNLVLFYLFIIVVEVDVFTWSEWVFFCSWPHALSRLTLLREKKEYQQDNGKLVVT